jgi:hypothetical protein
MENLFVPGSLDLSKILEELSSIGATSLRILNESFRKALLKEAAGYEYQPKNEVVGSGDRIVRQQLSSFENFPSESRYLLLRDSFQDLIERGLAGLEPYPFERALNFDSMVLQKYEEGSLGITSHKDGLSFINLVCIFIIGGKGRFYVCSDRSGRAAKEIDAFPGYVILMRAPGFFGAEDDRPFHYVTDIPTKRYSFGLRQRQANL